MKTKTAPGKHILFLPRWYPNRYDPMPGLFIRRHALSVSKEWQVSVLYVHTDFNKIKSGYEIEAFHNDGITEVIVYTRAFHTGIAKLDSLLNLYRFFKAHLKGYRILRETLPTPALTHVNVLTRCGVVALFLKVFKWIPFVITEHWTRYLPGMDSFNGGFRKWISRIVVRNSSAVLPVTLNLQKAMESHGLTNSNYVVIPNVVDTSLFQPHPLPPAERERMFLHVSCFDDKQKNISGILNVLKRLSEKRQDWKCIMVGEGIHFKELVAYAEELKLKDTFVQFTGLKENQELVRLMQKAQFQLMFSRYENLPVVIPESFACGVPFISTNVGGIAEHIHPQLGILLD